MAIRAEPPESRSDGVYRWLLDREEDKVRRFSYNDGTPYAYPRWRLELLRAGEPVDVPMWILPKWAWVRIGRLSPDGLGWRAIVHADDTIVVESYKPGQWLDERGDLFNEALAQ